MDLWNDLKTFFLQSSLWGKSKNIMYVTVSSNLTSVSILSPQAQKMICLFWCNGFLITRGKQIQKQKIKRIHLSSSTLVISKLTVLIFWWFCINLQPLLCYWYCMKHLGKLVIIYCIKQINSDWFIDWCYQPLADWTNHIISSKTFNSCTKWGFFKLEVFFILSKNVSLCDQAKK